MKKFKYFLLNFFKRFQIKKDNPPDEKESDHCLKINRCEVKKINFKING